MNETYPKHLMAQKLNNFAAFCIETGRYKRAISNLVRALKLAEQVGNVAPCNCQYCSFEACMSFSRNLSSPFQSSSTSSSSLHHHHATSSGGKTTSAQSFSKQWMTQQRPSSNAEDQEGYIHRQPIRITTKSMEEGHPMGRFLTFIATFNLALVSNNVIFCLWTSGAMFSYHIWNIALTHSFFLPFYYRQTTCQQSKMMQSLPPKSSKKCCISMNWSIIGL